MDETASAQRDQSLEFEVARAFRVARVDGAVTEEVEAIVEGVASGENAQGILVAIEVHDGLYHLRHLRRG